MREFMLMLMLSIGLLVCMTPALAVIMYSYDTVQEQQPVYKTRVVDGIAKCRLNMNTSSMECVTPRIEERYIDGYVTVQKKSIRQGIIINDNTYPYANIYDGKLIIWSVPIGERNFNEYPSCLSWEEEKGICRTVILW